MAALGTPELVGGISETQLIHRVRPVGGRAKALYALLIAVAAFLLAAVLMRLGGLEGLENLTWAWRARTLAKPSASTAKIKLILIDQASLDWARKENQLGWPWPRELYSVLLDFCQRSQARVVAFDLIYSEPSLYGVNDDEVFGAALRRHGNCVVAFYAGKQSADETSWPAHLPPPLAAASDLGAWWTPLRRRHLAEPRASFPVPQVATNAFLLAGVTARLDPDGVVRRTPPVLELDGKLAPSLGLAAFLAGADSVRRLEVADGELRIGALRLPSDRSGRLIPRFRGPSGTHQAFSAAGVIQSELRLRTNGVPPIAPQALRDCFVVIGCSAPGLKDLRPTPVSGDYPGVEIHATLLDNLLAQDLMREASPVVAWLWMLALAVAASLLMVFSQRAVSSVLAFMVFLPLPFLAGFAAYAAGFWFPVAGPLVACGLALLGAFIFNYSTEGRQKRFIRSAFGQYLSGEVIDLMLQNPEQLTLGGEKRELTMFFSDLEKFSSFSERLPPAQLTALLNDYLTDMTRIILEEGGTVDKYVGDAVVAFWNAPVSQPDHAARACRAAVRCQRQLAARRAEFEQRAGAPFRMRVGLNTGEVTVGNLGSKSRFNYTVLGDAANLASRLEGANKFFGTFTLAASSVWPAACSAVTGRELGALRVVGRAAPVVVYEISGLAGEEKPAAWADFARGLALCRERKWREAEEWFARHPDDPPACLYREKCRRLREGTEADWDLVWNLSEK